MSFRVNTNVSSMNFTHRMARVNQETEKNLSRLASGDRISEVAFDPAGLAISEKMRSLIRSRDRATRNASESVALFQVAEGAMSTMQEMAIRMRQLAVQSATDTIGSARDYTQKEFAQLKREIQRIAVSTQYNEKKLLDSQKSMSFQIGVHNRADLDRIRLDQSTIQSTLGRLGLESLSVESKEEARQALNPLKDVLDDLSRRRTIVGALHTRMLDVIGNNEQENFSEISSQSRIRDADYAQETAQRAKLVLQSEATVKGLVHAQSFQASQVMRLLT